MKISDIDFERKTIHIRQSKYKKDRIVPLSDFMAKGLKKYLTVEKPHIWLFMRILAIPDTQSCFNRTLSPVLIGQRVLL